ncbi:HD domain-containing protein [Actibacterium lipolyticum]|uniref:5'-nucleotidase n=1 Tax=Actibacterium lipolyticum TaxID=1524263 RepID=A0A238JYM6_9RHOB|nr:HD domain-containing protein [Actibacterium lipolyticum]SMX34806.1 5'-nucleotidase [Actibacterium lipolyticum]
MSERLSQQLAFLIEADKLKSVSRASSLSDNSRKENSGEHSWHVALYALTLAEHAEPGVRIDRVIRMLLIHDLVEIDAGDAPIHGDHDAEALALAEQQAADRLFSLLPTDTAVEMRALWDEFEAAQSPDAVFAKSVDRMQPVLQNLANGGGSWVDYDVSEQQIAERVGAKVARGSPALWEHLRGLITAHFSAR